MKRKYGIAVLFMALLMCIMPVRAEEAEKTEESLFEYGCYEGFSGEMCDHFIYGISDDASGEITIPDGETFIGENAFKGCEKIEKVIIPGTVTWISDNAFANCPNLETVVMEEYCAPADEGVYLGNSVFANCPKLTTVVLSDYIREIPERTFENCSSLKEYIVPKCVNTIEDSAFQGSGLEKIVLSDSVRYWGENVFADCVNLEFVTLSKGSYYLAEGIFKGCSSLKEFIIPEGVTSIRESAFQGSGIQHIMLPDSVNSIESSVFADCDNLESIELPESLDETGKYMFRGCDKLTSIEFLQNIKTISEGTFKDCDSLVSVTIPDSVTYIGVQAFGYCNNLKDIIFTDSLEEIGSGAFRECTGLERIDLPKSLTYIGEGAFRYCSNLKEISFSNGPDTLGKRAFGECTSLIDIVLPEGIAKIRANVFENCTSLRTVQIPESIVEMANKVFKGCGKQVVVYTDSEYVKGILTEDNVTTDGIYDGPVTFELNKSVYHPGDKFEKDSLKIYGLLEDGSKKELKASVMGFDSSKVGICKLSVKHPSKEEEFEINIHDMLYGEKVVETPATKNAIGKYYFKCGIEGCDKKEYSVIPKLKRIEYVKQIPYNGKVQKNSINVLDVGWDEIAKENYTITGTTSAKKIGEYKFTIKLKNEYSGSYTYKWQIQPKETWITGHTAVANKVTLKWAQNTLADGYRIYFSEYDKDKIGYDSLAAEGDFCVKGSKSTKTTLELLEYTEKIKVAICSYKIVNGKKIYSSISPYRYIDIKRVKLNKETVRLRPGKSVQLKVQNYTGKVTWTSNSKNVTVSKKGLVKAKKNSTATVTAKLANGKKYTCKVYVGPYVDNVKIQLMGGTGKSKNVYLKVENYGKNTVKVFKPATIYPLGTKYSGYKGQHIYYGTAYEVYSGEKESITFRPKSGAVFNYNKNKKMLCIVSINGKQYSLLVGTDSVQIL